MADSKDEIWPDPVYFPQKTDGTPLLQPKLLPTKPEKEKKGIWPFNHKKAPPQPIPTEEQIVKVGPKDPPPSPYPLVRIPMIIQTELGLVQPGIYLIKPAQSKTAEATALPPQSGDAPAGKTFILTQRDRLILQFQVHPISLPDPNIETEGTASPLTKTDKKLPTPMKVEVKISADRKTLTIQVTQDGQTFESPSFPTATDRRPVLQY